MTVDPNAVPLPGLAVWQLFPGWTLPELWMAVDAARMGAPSYPQLVEAVRTNPQLQAAMLERDRAIIAATPPTKVIEGQAEELPVKLARLHVRLAEEQDETIREILRKAIAHAQGKLSDTIEAQLKELNKGKRRA